MNRNLKFAIAAAIASLGVTGQAHAFTQSTTGTSGSLFLYVFDDRTTDPTATNTAIFDLGAATSFDNTANQSWSFGANSAWTSFVSTIANQANVKWGVFGAYGPGNLVGSSIFTTLSAVPSSVNEGSTVTAIASANAMLNYYGLGNTSAGSTGVQSSLDAGAFGYNAAGAIGNGGVLTTGLGSSMDFFKYTTTSTKNSSLDTKTAYAFGSDADYFILGNNGTLTYTAAAAVPEADSYTMMLAGLGLVGYMVRRRKAS